MGTCCGTCMVSGTDLAPLVSLRGPVITSSSFGSAMLTLSGSGFFGPILPVGSQGSMIFTLIPKTPKNNQDLWSIDVKSCDMQCSSVPATLPKKLLVRGLENRTFTTFAIQSYHKPSAQKFESGIMKVSEEKSGGFFLHAFLLSSCINYI